MSFLHYRAHREPQKSKICRQTQSVFPRFCAFLYTKSKRLFVVLGETGKTSTGRFLSRSAVELFPNFLCNSFGEKFVKKNRPTFFPRRTRFLVPHRSAHGFIQSFATAVAAAHRNGQFPVHAQHTDGPDADHDRRKRSRGGDHPGPPPGAGARVDGAPAASSSPPVPTTTATTKSSTTTFHGHGDGAAAFSAATLAAPAPATDVSGKFVGRPASSGRVSVPVSGGFRRRRWRCGRGIRWRSCRRLRGTVLRTRRTDDDVPATRDDEPLPTGPVPWWTAQTHPFLHRTDR